MACNNKFKFWELEGESILFEWGGALQGEERIRINKEFFLGAHAKPTIFPLNRGATSSPYHSSHMN
jgi:hypothetical protein